MTQVGSIKPNSVEQTVQATFKEAPKSCNLYECMIELAKEMIKLQREIKAGSSSQSIKFDTKYSKLVKETASETKWKGFFTGAIQIAALGIPSAGTKWLGPGYEASLKLIADNSGNIAGMGLSHMDANINSNNHILNELNTQMQNNNSTQSDTSLRDQMLQELQKVGDLFKQASRG